MKQKGKLFKKILEIILAVLIVAGFVLVIVTSISGKRKGKPVFIFGYSLMWVVTGSMEPVIPERSYILTKYYDGGEISEGDVITFICKDVNSEAFGSLITHRVELVTDEGYKTKGDNNSVSDGWVVLKEDVVAVSFKNLPVATFLGRVFSSEIGLIIVIVLFVGSCVFLYMPEIIKNLKNDEEKNSKEEEMQRRIASEIEKMRKEDAEKAKNEEISEK